MGFWNFAKKMVQGKPIFETPHDQSSSPPSETVDPNADYKKDLPPEEPGKKSVEQSRRYDEHGKEQLPRVEMSYSRCLKDDQNIQVWGRIVNNSPVNIYLDKVTLCGSEVAFDYPLAPGQSHDFMVYDGAKPTTPNDCYSDVYYRDRGTGEYFVMQHMINFRDDQNGTFSPARIFADDGAICPACDADLTIERNIESMGFWDVTKRMLQGKPAFEVTQAVKSDSGASPQQATEANVRLNAQGNKILPEAFVGRCKYEVSGEHMQVYAHIHNHSQVPIFLDKITLVGMTQELDYELQPGQSRELRIYNGPVPHTAAYTQADLYYRDNGNGDYFQARHTIEYNFENGVYCIEELHPVRPVVDI